MLRAESESRPFALHVEFLSPMGAVVWFRSDCTPVRITGCKPVPFTAWKGERPCFLVGRGACRVWAYPPGGCGGFLNPVRLTVTGFQARSAPSCCR